MTHKHDWVFENWRSECPWCDSQATVAIANCRTCPATMGPSQIEALLNKYAQPATSLEKDMRRLDEEAKLDIREQDQLRRGNG